MTDAKNSGQKPAPVIPQAEEDITAVWDDEAVRAAGLLDHGESLPRSEIGVATAPSVRGEDRASVVVTDTSRVAAVTIEEQEEEEDEDGTGLSWPITAALAISVGIAVFFAVRFFLAR